MAEAIFGLVGVIVGAAVTGGSDYVLERRREHAEQRQAKRLVASELHTIWVHLGLLASEGRTPTTPLDVFGDRFMPSSLWDAHRGTLAKALSDEDWEALFLLYDNATGLRLIVATLSPATNLAPLQRVQVSDLMQDAARAYTKLTGRSPEGGAAQMSSSARVQSG